jgi:hypothetical protein
MTDLAAYIFLAALLILLSVAYYRRAGRFQDISKAVARYTMLVAIVLIFFNLGFNSGAEMQFLFDGVAIKAAHDDGAARYLEAVPGSPVPLHVIGAFAVTAVVAGLLGFADRWRNIK